MALLYGDLDLKESGQVVEALGRQHIAYRIAGQGGQILVPSDQVARARMLLARDGLPSGGSIGYEIFDRGDGLAATQFQQTINETRALEGELARTIRAMDGIRAVRVHLVLPRREPFARERQDAQASVMLTMAGAARLDREGVQSILTLVAAAVPGLKPRNISLVDSHGTLLARAGQPVGAAGGAQDADEIRRGTELRLSRAVEEMLERTLGPGHVRAEAAVEMDFDRVNETQEKYDPDGQVVRSQQTSTTKWISTASTRRRRNTTRTGRWYAASRPAPPTTAPRKRRARCPCRTTFPMPMPRAAAGPAARKASRKRPPTTRSAARSAR
jgi:flagellar M-ring protein FliF